MKLKDCRVDGAHRIDLEDYPTDAKMDKKLKADYVARTEANNRRMGELQDKLYADAHEGVVILLQAMDAAGKDSTIKHVMSGVNPQGVDVYSYKQPSSEELAHDYLWRAEANLPRRGKMAIFNRSYYEDVLVVRVHELWKGYSMPARCIDGDEDEFFGQRYDQIADYERYLWENGYRVCKIFLHVGKDAQKKRFLQRIDDESKNWKFSASDLKERALWPKYKKAYEDAINGTATEHTPWYVIPADQKWYARWLVSEAILDVLEDCNPHYPEMPPEQRDRLIESKTSLLEEDGGNSELDREERALDAEKKSKKKDKKKKGKKGKKKDKDKVDEAPKVAPAAEVAAAPKPEPAPEPEPEPTPAPEVTAEPAPEATAEPTPAPETSGEQA